MDRQMLLRIVADRVWDIANDGESRPDYRWMDQYIDEVCDRYKVKLTSAEKQQVDALVREMS